MTWPDQTDRIILDQVDSTMAEAARRAAGLRRPTWILARTQTAARGRRGRAWANPAGNFAATYVFKPECPPNLAALRSFSAANAVFDALSGLVEAGALALKWPNDVLLSGGKVAGILLESAGGQDRVDWLSIGIGVNLAEPAPMPDAVFPPVALGTTISPEELLTLVAGEMAAQERVFVTQGFAPIRDRWLARAARLGDVITARTNKSEITGTFETIDDDGQLVLLTPKGQVHVPAADVYF